MDKSISWSVSGIGPEGARNGADAAFLAPAEQLRLAAMRFEKRRREWLHGRRTAKTLARQVCPQLAGRDLSEICIENEAGGAPYLAIAGQERLPACLSISHRDEVAFCALTQAPGVRMGVDVERVEPRERAFVEDYFTLEEVGEIDSCAGKARDLRITLGWSAKEAALKALGLGLRVDTRRVEILGVAGLDGPGDRWKPLDIRCSLVEGRWSAWWRKEGEYVFTIAMLGARGISLPVPGEIPTIGAK